MPARTACTHLLSSVDIRNLLSMPEAASTGPRKEMVLIFDLPGALAPSLVATGYERTEHNVFTVNDAKTSVQFYEDPFETSSWWIVIILDNDLKSESKVDSIIQAFRLLWTFGAIALIEQTAVSTEFQRSTEQFIAKNNEALQRLKD